MATTIESTNQVRWDLSILYSDIDDPRLDSDLSELTAMAKHFSLTYKGKLAELLGAAIRDYSEIEMLSGKITSYLFLRESTDLTNAAIKAKHAALSARIERDARASTSPSLNWNSSSSATRRSRICMKAIRSSPSIARGSSTYAYSSRTF